MINEQKQPPQQPTTIEEEILWHRILTKGVFRKKVIEGLVVTNRRVIKELPQSGHLFTLPLTEIDSIQVVNQHRDSNFHTNMAGIHTQILRMGHYYGQSKGKNMGDILFMSRDHQHFAFNNVGDPAGLAKLVSAAQDLLLEE